MDNARRLHLGRSRDYRTHTTNAGPRVTGLRRISELRDQLMRILCFGLTLLTFWHCAAIGADAPRPERAKPKWVWLNQANQPAAKLYFRKEIVVRSAVAAARLYAAGDDALTVYIDGQEVLQHGDWSKPAFKDVAALFEKQTPGGRHVIGVEAMNADAAGAAGMLFRLDFESGWRDAWSIVSDDSWQVADEPAKGWNSINFKNKTWKQPTIVAQLGGAPWQQLTAATLAAAAPLKEPTATTAESLKLAKGFKAELLYSVPKGEQGSWVNMCVDPKGRLIVSDQYGLLYRVTPPPIGTDAKIEIEKINVDIGEAQGLLWAFDSLYVVVNKGKKYDGGVYRVRDTDDDDQLDSVETLRTLNGRGEHGPHAVLLAPDGKSLFIVCGNGTPLTEFNESRVPRVWDEDQLLPRTYGRGFMKGKRAPGGYISRIDPDGKNWELVATGFRNEFDAAFNADGELFTFDADMEWDMNTPWYRPTRVCHVISGAEFGWRNGAGKWPVYYPDSLPAVVDIGPGSPTGICFGYGAKFPAKYQQALFINDWSYGKLYAVHLEPRGASYTAKLEDFVSGRPLPLTDVIVNPHDGAMYFTIGGRRVQSGLYRVTYQGDESTAAADARQSAGADQRAARRELEALHLGDHPRADKTAWPYLKSPDRFLRFAARIAVEHRPVKEWMDRALKESDPQTALAALLALVRQFKRTNPGKEPDIDTPPPNWSKADASSDNSEQAGLRAGLRAGVLTALRRLDWQQLNYQQKLELLRVYTVTFLRLGHPNDAARQSLIQAFAPRLPSGGQELDYELLQLLVYLQAPTAAAAGVALLDEAPTQEEQINIAKTLRHLRTGWTPELQRQYFSWFVKAGGFRGGASFSLFVQHVKEDAVANLSDAAKTVLKPILEAQPATEVTAVAAKPRPLVKEWSLKELVPLIETGLKNRNFEHGRRMFAAAKCFACHRFDNQGGAIGPDLTILSGRFSPREILDSIVDPSKVISDQYQAVTIVTLDGKVVTGRIVNLAGDSFRINTNMLDPDAQVGVDRKQIDTMVPSKVSMMPKGLLDTLNEEEILDLMAYLLSRGQREAAMFRPAQKTSE